MMILRRRNRTSDGNEQEKFAESGFHKFCFSVPGNCLWLPERSSARSGA
jgi:hypothetical protein